MSGIIPIFKSHYSIGRSILTCDKAEDKIDENKPVSIFSIGKKHNLKEIYLAESSMTGFIKAWEQSKDCGIPLRFGYQMVICQDINDKSEKSLETESKIIIWLKNDQGYKDLIKISSKASTDGFYYVPRLDFSNLKSMFSENLMVSIPFYSSFLHNNALKGYRCNPEFGKIKPSICIGAHNLPFDSIISQLHKDYAIKNNLETINISNVYYYKNVDWKQYCVFRSISNRSTFDCPNIDNFASDRFSFESYLNKNKI